MKFREFSGDLVKRHDVLRADGGHLPHAVRLHSARCVGDVDHPVQECDGRKEGEGDVRAVEEVGKVGSQPVLEERASLTDPRRERAEAKVENKYLDFAR